MSDMIVAYSGSRHLYGVAVIEAIGSMYKERGIVHAEHIPEHHVGDAPAGVDKVVRARLDELGIRPRVFKADWDQYGKAAGPIRNAAMVADADLLLAVWDGLSPGTLSAINAMAKLRRPISVRVLKAGTGCPCSEHRP